MMLLWAIWLIYLCYIESSCRITSLLNVGIDAPPKDLQDDFSRREAAGQHADFGIARRFVRMAMCMMRTSQVYLPPEMRSTHIKPERRADYYLAMWPYLRDKWSKANALKMSFDKNNPLGQWRNIVQELYGVTLKM